MSKAAAAPAAYDDAMAEVERRFAIRITNAVRDSIQSSDDAIAPLYGYSCQPRARTYRRARASDLAMPSYVLDIPGGFGKVPMEQAAIEKTADGSYIVTDHAGNRHTYL